ncbi:MAG TPA: tetratricopeptide repeat protein, partial [Gemmatimonadales bacterium]
MNLRSPCIAAWILLTGGAGLTAQSVAAGDSALARGDTAAAITAYEAAIKHNDHDAEAHYRVGLLYQSRVPPRSGPNEDRRRAEEHIRLAMRYQGDSAKYFLALADLHTGGLPPEGELIKHAAEVARQHPTGTGTAMQWRAAQLEWSDYEQQAHHYLFSGDSALLDVSFSFDNWNYIRRFATAEVTPDRGNPSGNYAKNAEIDLRGAITATPHFVRAAGLLVLLMGDQNRWEEAVDLARRLTTQTPDSGTAWALLGMAYARTHRWAEAQTAYDSAFRHLSDAEREPYDNLAFVLSPGEQSRWEATQAGDRRELAARFWASTQPLFLTDLNEARTEYYARVTFVITRWTDIVRGYRGYV